MNIKAILSFVAILVTSTFSGYAQEAAGEAAPVGEQPRKYNTWSAGLHFGHIMGLTDIRTYDYAPLMKYYSDNRFGVGLIGSKAFSNVFSLRGQFLYGGVAGTRRGDAFEKGTNKKAKPDFTGDIWYPNGVYFTTNILEGNLQLVFNVSNLAFSGKVGKERKFALYLFAGHGLVNFDSEVKWLAKDGDDNKDNDKEVNFIGPTPVKAGKTTEAVNPMGLGFKYKINNKIDLALEGTLRMVNTDKLDGWETGGSKDYYSYTSLTINYKFGKAGKEGESIEWVNPLDAMNNDIHRNRERINAIELDKDNDGVSDVFDKDTNTPEGDKVDGSGVSMDVDGDGVSDSKDEDNFTCKGCAVNESGIAVDSDGDGVDLEPNTEKGALVNFQGISIAKKGTSGGGGGGPAWFPSVNFELNSTSIGYNQYDKIATIARAMKTNKDMRITLTGHTDPSGSEDYNLKLGERRAKALADHLAKHYGISADRMTIASKGESEQLADKINSVNRRVDVTMN